MTSPDRVQTSTGRKVGGCDRIPVSSKEGTPGRAARALWSWLDAVGFENVANRGVRDVEAQVG